MVHFTIDRFRATLSVPSHIRNISVIAHVDHGKSTLTDSLLHRAGFLSGERTGKARLTDTREDEQLRCITIKSTGVSLLFDIAAHDRVDTEETPYVVNLIDSPGHVDFSSEVTAAIRCSDGALVVVDCIEGCCAQTETVMRQALQERVRPVLVLNKLDRLILEQQLDPEEAYQALLRTIERSNVIASLFADASFGDADHLFDPAEGTCCFCSGLFGFGFTLRQFARIYAPAEPEKLLPRLWGDHFYDPKARRWSRSPTASDGRALPRGFVHFVLDPVFRLVRAMLDDDATRLATMLDRLHLTLSPEDREKQGKHLIKPVMQKWLHAADALLELIVRKLPSPVTAQQYRTETLYSGPDDDECAQAMRACDPDGPLMMYVSKMVPTTGNRFLAFGRIFSGTISTGQSVRVQSSEYTPGRREGLRTVNVQRVVATFPRSVEALDSCPCGSTVALLGIDQALRKSGTLTTSPTAHNIAPMRFSVSAVVQMAVRPKEARDLTKFIEGLRRLVQTDPCLQVISKEETGEHVLCGSGELHLEICVNDLRAFCSGMEIIAAPPVVSFCETVRGTSEAACLAKSSNHHNRVWTTAEPLGEELTSAIDKGEISVRQDERERSRKLVERYQWDLTDSRKIWTFGPNETGPNILVDQTKGVQYVHEARDSFCVAFNGLTACGPLCDEPLRGVRLNVTALDLHADSIHRGPGQIIPAAQRSFAAAVLRADPALLEPIYLVDIQAPQSCMGSIHQVLHRRRGVIVSSEVQAGTPLLAVRAYMPIAESFRFTDELRAQTSGQAFPQCLFDHWQLVDEDVRLRRLVAQTRARKKLPEPEAFPRWDALVDRL